MMIWSKTVSRSDIFLAFRIANYVDGYLCWQQSNGNIWSHSNNNRQQNVDKMFTVFAMLTDAFLSLAEDFLRGIMYVEKTIFASIFSINFGQCFAQRYQRSIVHQEEEGFGWSNLHAAANDWHKLWHGELLWHQKFTLFQLWQIGLFGITFNNYLFKVQ